MESIFQAYPQLQLEKESVVKLRLSAYNERRKENMETRKQLKDLNLLDRFLFAEAMEDSVIMESMLEIILGRDVVLKHLPQTEKEQRKSPLQRFVKLDVYALDTEDNVYDTEVQKENTYNLPKRSRLYQGLIDVRLLPPGEVDFNALKNVFIIMITPFDLFKKGRYRYTFQMHCLEEPDVFLEDGATRIFLNTRGTDRQNVSDELIELLQYIENTTKEVSSQCKSERIQEMHKRIEAIKSNEEIGVKYMQEWEEKIIEKRKAREEGLAEGRAEGRAEGLAAGRAEGEAEGRALGEAEAKESFNKLVLLLSKDNRLDDIVKAASNPEYLNELYQEYGIGS